MIIMKPGLNSRSGTEQNPEILRLNIWAVVTIRSLICCILPFFLICGISFADRLPSATNDTQQFTIDTMIDATGSYTDETRIDWNLVKNGSLSDTSLGKGGIIAAVTYLDTLLSNGGNLSETKNTGFDSSSMKSGLYNINSEKVLTYGSSNGSFLTGGEYLLLDIAGNYSSDKTSDIKCLFEIAETTASPAFCNVVKAQSDLINMNTVQISTKSQLRAVGSSSVSSGVGYRIAVSPDTGSENRYAEGTVRTEFAGSITEARDGKKSTSSTSKSSSSKGSTSSSSSSTSKSSSSSEEWKTPSATNQWKDMTEVTGGITNLQKTFGYQSGMKL